MCACFGSFYGFLTLEQSFRFLDCSRMEDDAMEDKIRYLAKQYANSHAPDSTGLSSSIVIKNVLADNGWTQEQDGNSRIWKQQIGCSRSDHFRSMGELLTHFSASLEHRHLIALLFDSVRAHKQSRSSKKLKSHHSLPSGDSDVDFPHPPPLPPHDPPPPPNPPHDPPPPHTPNEYEIWIAARDVLTGSLASHFARHVQTCTSAMQLLNKWIETGRSAVGMPRMPAELYAILQDASLLSCLSPETRSLCAQLRDNEDCEVMRDAANILPTMAEVNPKPKIRAEDSDDETLVRELDIMNKVIDLLSPMYLNLCPDVLRFAKSLEDKLKARARSDDVRALLRNRLYEDMRVLKKRKNMARFIADGFAVMYPVLATASKVNLEYLK
ncbi:hypothetical protein CEUSTIGMA_g13718.t1 [Chlamydomonas eustigma]|uniref:Uncharacterized protein n=1 Tax=Chlamydomonas eustigma TaxID=1157962 RepID=A0A250XTD5_9CHLO|nr:hypothetical protein CEUSTIGMA_g13718.t1 [Chlamydomonas eustigma]|eukprot:GAX86306.1 hypothetical protein CEUSTIGMA_g13718.t1 [Chlamydomonas eustigma]